MAKKPAVSSAATSATRVNRLRARRRANGLRVVTFWLPNIKDPEYRKRIAKQCRRLAVLTPEEAMLAEDFAALAARNLPPWD